MATLTNVELPPPRNWQDFENLCRDLWQRIWDDPDTQKNGRAGQPQTGVDVFGRPSRGTRWAGVQCKLKSQAAGESLSEAGILKEVSRAREFRPPLSTFIVATTARRDARAQELARRITEEQIGRGEFSVAVFAWEDIVLELARHEDLVALHFPQFTLRTAGAARLLTLPPPKLPPHYLARPSHLASLKAKLLTASENRIGITGQGMVGVQGMGGIGKTVLAAAVAQDEEVQQAFPDGVCWLSVGQEPDLVDLLRLAAQAFGDPAASFTAAGPGKNAVRALLAGRKVLLVLDDVWTLAAAESLDLTSGESRTLLTSRNAEVMIGLGATEHRVDLLDWEQALDLLASWAGCAAPELPGEAREVAKECGRLPLALAMAGAMIRLRPAAWQDALELFRDADLEALRLAFPGYPYPDLLRAIEVSVQSLEPWQQERYLELAVFAEEVAIPEPALVTLWSAGGLRPREARDLAGTLVNRALARYDDQGRLALHDLQRDYLQVRASGLALHHRLVEAYRAGCGDGFASGPDDGYFFQWLPRHLHAAGLAEELRTLLFDYRWLDAKLRAAGIGALVRDLDLAAPDREVLRLRQELRLCAHILARDPAELASQLLGRLQPTDGPGVERLLRSIDRPGVWLRPRRPSFSGLGPKGFLERTFEEPRRIDALTKLADRQVIAGSFGGPLLHLDLETGRVVRTFTGHAGAVTGLALLDSRYLISTSRDGRIRIWSLETGSLESTLRGEPDKSTFLDFLAADPRYVIQLAEDRFEVRSTTDGKILMSGPFGPPPIEAAVLLEGYRLVAAAYKPHLTVWDLAGRKILSDHSCGDSPPHLLRRLDARRFAVGLEDGTVQIWSAETLRPLLSLDGDPGGGGGRGARALVALEAAGERTLLAAKGNGQIYVWDTEEGRLIRMIAVEQSLDALVSLGDLALCGVRFGDLSLVDLGRGETLCSWPAHADSARPLLALDSRHVVSASVDGLRCWDFSGAREVVVASRPSILHLAWTRLGVAAVTHNGEIGRLDLASCELGARIPVHPAGIIAIAALGDGRILSLGKEDGIAVTNLETGQVDRRFEFDCSSFQGINVLPGERVVAHCTDGALRIIDWGGGKLERLIRVHSDRLDSAIVMDDRTLIVGLNTGELRALDWVTGKTTAILCGPGDDVPRLCKLDGRRFVSAGFESCLRAWELQPGFRSGRLLWSVDGNGGSIIHTICPLGPTHFVVATSACTLCVWNVETGLLEATLSTDAPVWTLIYLPDERALAAADSQGDVHVLDFVQG